MKLFAATIAAACALQQMLAQNSSSTSSRATASSPSTISRSTSSRTSTTSSSFRPATTAVSTSSSQVSQPSPSLYVSASQVVQCSNAQISWGGGQKPYSLTVTIQGGTDPQPVYNTYDQSRGFVVNAPAGNQVIVTVTDANSGMASQEYTVGDSADDSCLSSASASTSSSLSVSQSPSNSVSTATSSSITISSTQSNASEAALSTGTIDPSAFNAKKTNVGAIAGGVVGGLAVLAILGGAIFLLRRNRKEAQKERVVYRRWSEGQITTPYSYYAQRAGEGEMMEK